MTTMVALHRQLHLMAVDWLRGMLAPLGPLELVDANGRRWVAQPVGDGFAYVCLDASPSEEATEALRRRPPPLALRVHGYFPTVQPAKYRQPKPPTARTSGIAEEPYFLLRRIGQGSYGQVWLARTRRHDFVAVKWAHRGFAIQLAHEAAVLADVKHGCIVACKAFLSDACGGAALVQPLARTTLREVLASPVTPRTTLRCLEALRAGLLALHAAGYVHLDLSPQNVLLFHDNSVRLADLGTAQREGEELRDLYVGTRKYRAPEILLGARRVQRSMDLWSLGMLALELALRSEQLRGVDSLQQLVIVLMLLGPPTPAELGALLPDWVPTADASRSPSQDRSCDLLQCCEVVDSAAFELAAALLHYAPTARRRGVAEWPKLMRRLRGPPRAPANRPRS